MPKTKAPALDKAKSAPAAVKTTTPLEKKKIFRHTKAAFILTGPVNVMGFFPLFMAIGEIWKEGWQVVRPCFAMPLFPLGDVPAAIARAQPEAIAISAGLLVLAVTCLVGGIGLLRHTMGLIDATGGTIAPNDPPPVLIVTGAYAYVRNPMAIAQLLILLSEGLLLGIPRVLALAGMYAAFLFVYTPCSEEPDLARRFGADWGRYLYHVGAWWPRCSPWQPALEQL